MCAQVHAAISSLNPTSLVCICAFVCVHNVPVCTGFSLCAFFDAAGQPLAKKVLMECQTRFLEVVAVTEIYRELCQKCVIPQTVADKISISHSVKEARRHLFDHMRDYGTLDTLKVFCDVITSEQYDGFQAMQDFGSEMRRLEQEGRCVH